MIDRKARDELLSDIDAYLTGEIMAFDFDERLSELPSDDETVDFVVRELWFFYDDCTDHEVSLSKEGWDDIQRLILVLRSNAEVRVRARRRWSAHPIIAGIALLAFVLMATRLGWGYHLFLLALPFGVLSVALSRSRDRWRDRVARTEHEPREHLFPFASMGEIRTAHCAALGFRKRRYPAELGSRRIRGRFEESVLRALSLSMWMLFSPAVLLLQMLPQRDDDVRVVIGGSAG